MESTNTFETFLWFLAGFISSGMIVFLVLGWLKGNQWQREMKVRRRQSHR